MADYHLEVDPSGKGYDWLGKPHEVPVPGLIVTLLDGERRRITINPETAEEIKSWMADVPWDEDGGFAVRVTRKP